MKNNHEHHKQIRFEQRLKFILHTFLFSIVFFVFLTTYRVYRQSVITTNEGNAYRLLTDMYLVQENFIDQNNDNYGNLQELMGLISPQNNKSKIASPTIVKDLYYDPS